MSCSISPAREFFRRLPGVDTENAFRVKLGPGTFAGLSWGHAGAPPLLLVHGFNQTSHSWEEVGAALGQDYHVVAFDQRGHGQSMRAADGDYSREAMVDDMRALVDHLGLKQFRLVGMSMGAAHALSFTAQHPHRVKSLVLVDYAPTVDPEGVQKIKAMFMQSFDSFEQAVQAVHLFNPRRTKANIESRLRHTLAQRDDGRFTWNTDPAFAFQERFSEPPEVMWAQVPHVTPETLVVHGAMSDVLKSEAATRLAKELPHGALAVIQGAGHSVPGDNPQAFLSAVQSFLR